MGGSEYSSAGVTRQRVSWLAKSEGVLVCMPVLVGLQKSSLNAVFGAAGGQELYFDSVSVKAGAMVPQARNTAEERAMASLLSR
ncbi:hypothetical protein F442_22672 [Phytophthora nicotianae P10297]|uniref:Uncharacterized protein n=1 Tax=Phytophthora nicotianae P10297 TaxID=1317064 RepID=W2XZX3_PHYNI|nr:hypothetical protein F442_22672 [Phytophthora nicotianae P10297]